jgi:hypothetical protein
MKSSKSGSMQIITGTDPAPGPRGSKIYTVIKEERMFLQGREVDAA